MCTAWDIWRETAIAVGVDDRVGVARGGEIEVAPGDWMPKRLAILEFDSMEQARSWLASPENTALDDIRSGSSNINLVLVSGV